MPQNIPNPSQGLSNLLHRHSTQSPPYRHHNFIARRPCRHDDHHATTTVPPQVSYRYCNGTSTTNVRTQRPTRSYGHDDRHRHRTLSVVQKFVVELMLK